MVYLATREATVPAGTRGDLSDTLMVLGLEGRLLQVIRNLLANTVSCSPLGETIILSAERYDIWTKVIVEDEGAGMPAGKASAIFERFYSA